VASPPFVAIGLKFSLRGPGDAGLRPVAVFALATVPAAVVGFGLASVLLGNVRMG